MSAWYETLAKIVERGEETVLVTMFAATGSTPRDVGAKMIVSATALHGSVGGGKAEYEAIQLARRMLESGAARQAQRYGLQASFGQHCGGSAELLFERVSAGTQWVGVLARWMESGTHGVVVTLSGEDGQAGKLLVRQGEHWGSLGSSERDAKAVERAHALLRDSAGAVVFEDCAGAPALFERIAPVDFDIVLFGAGHVGRALARVLGVLSARVTWVDSRASEFPEAVATNVRVTHTASPLEQVREARPGSFFLVMTHSHALDLDLVEAILRRGDAAFCGMIGSRTKSRTFRLGLRKRGLPEEAIDRFICPIGIASVKGKDPGSIAVAVAAHLLAVREGSAAATASSPAA